MAGQSEDEAPPEFARGVSGAAKPEPTAPTVPHQPPPDAGEPTQTAIEYADPVDPWAAAEAAAIAAGGKPSYEAPPAGHGDTWTVPGDAEPLDGKHRPKRISRGLLIGGAATMVAAGVIAAAVLLWPSHPALDFHRIEEVRRLAPAVAYTSAFTATEVVGDRAYFAGVDSDGNLRVLAAGTGAGDEPLWENTSAGQSATWTAMRATPSVVVLFSGVESATRTSRMVVLDAETGSRLWEQRVGYDDEIHLGAETALWTDRERKRLVGLDLTEGREKWSQPDEDATTIQPIPAPDDLSGPARTTGQAFGTGIGARFVQFDADKTVTVRELATGNALQTRENVSAGGDKATVLDNRLYVQEPGTPERIFRYDLAALATEPGALYTVPTAQRIDGLTPCGDQLCFIRTTGYDKATSEVVAVGDGGWHLAVPNTETLVPVGADGLLAIGGESTTLIVDRKVVWTMDGGVAARLDAGNVLRFSEDLSNSAGSRALSGFHLGDEAGAVEEMGEIRDVRSESCSWNTEVIACVAAEDLVVYSFAG